MISPEDRGVVYCMEMPAFIPSNNDRVLDKYWKLLFTLSADSRAELKSLLCRLPYDAFLKTQYWFLVRRAVRSRDDHRCRRCTRQDPVNQVHHTTYDHHGEEHRFLRDLVTVCRKCHEFVHSPGKKKDRYFALPQSVRKLRP